MTDILDDTRNPAAMAPSERRCEIAAILAKGVLRLRQCRENPPGSQPSRTAEQFSKPPEIGKNGLDDGAEMSPHVLAAHGLVNGRENVQELDL